MLVFDGGRKLVWRKTENVFPEIVKVFYMIIGV